MPAAAAENPNRIEALCANYGLRMTGQRRVIARVLSSANDHPDVEEVHRRAHAVDAKISLSTVYRTIKLFSARGIIERHDFGHSRGRYEEATREFEAALHLAQDPMAQAEIEGKLGEVAFKRGDIKTATTWIEHALSQLGLHVPRWSFFGADMAKLSPFGFTWTLLVMSPAYRLSPTNPFGSSSAVSVIPHRVEQSLTSWIKELSFSWSNSFPVKSYRSSIVKQATS